MLPGGGSERANAAGVLPFSPLSDPLKDGCGAPEPFPQGTPEATQDARAER